MTVVFLTGGMGNQMFQYACGRCLATKRGDELILFVGALRQPQARYKYSLTALNIAPRAETNLHFLRSSDVLWVATQIDSRFNQAILCADAPNVALRGYWESEQYFSEIKEIIRREFTFRGGTPLSQADLAQDIGSSESVCVHVRRADILRPDDPKGFVGVEYYEAAFRYMACRLERPKFFVFSDDIRWCRENLNIPFPHCFRTRLAGETGPAEGDDLRLMSQCKNFIIANSTFSWWAAWLGSAPNKMVVAPRRWFVQEGLWHTRIVQSFRSDDLIPTGWIRL
jgi:hypothetical protein